MISCLLQAVFVKYLLYRLVGLLNGVEYMTGADEFWLFDWSSNPINLPGIVYLKRPNVNP
jgi:hypothetical protein